jgi:hypothetical protein
MRNHKYSSILSLIIPAYDFRLGYNKNCKETTFASKLTGKDSKPLYTGSKQIADNRNNQKALPSHQ